MPQDVTPPTTSPPPSPTTSSPPAPAGAAGALTDAAKATDTKNNSGLRVIDAQPPGTGTKAPEEDSATQREAESRQLADGVDGKTNPGPRSLDL